MKLTEGLSLQNDKTGKIFWYFAIPSIISMLIQSSAQFIDSIFIGNFIGPNALSALTLGFPYVGLLFGVGLMIAIGSSTLAGIELGKNNPKDANNFFNVANVLTIFLSVFTTTIVIFALPTIAKSISSDMEVQNHLMDYFSTIAVFFLPFIINIVFTIYLQLSGKPNLAVTFSICGIIINVILDYLLIKTFELGMTGAALATGLSQLIPGILGFIAIIKYTDFTFKWPSFDLKAITSMLLNGSSEMLSTGAASIAGIIINTILMKYMGEKGIAAYTVALQLSAISSAFFYGLAGALQSPVSVNVGAKSFKRVDSFLHMARNSVIVMGVALFALAYFGGEILAGIFVSDPELISLASHILKLYGLSYLFLGFNIVYTTYYTAVNSPVISGSIAVAHGLIGLVIGLAILPNILGSDGIFLSIAFSELITLLYVVIIHKVKPYGSQLPGKHSIETAA